VATIAELRRVHDQVLVDTPPINIHSDAGVVGRAVRDALIVVRMNKTPREATDRAIRLLRAARAEPLGIVLTHQRFHIPSYIYKYT
jgi:Mrp family chromosome partitioning ATPase